MVSSRGGGGAHCRKNGGSNSDDGSLRQWCGWRRQAIGGQSGSMCKCLLLHKEQRFL